MSTRSARRRVCAALEGGLADRPPICFWQHFAVGENPDRLAAATLDFFVEAHDLDVVKIMPDLGHPAPLGSVIHREDWLRLGDDLRGDAWAQAHRRCTELVVAGTPDDRPVVVTLFSPMATAAHLAPGLDALLDALRRWPDAVADALEALVGLLAGVARDVVDVGADGVFLGMQGCGVEEVDGETYRRHVRAAEAAVLSAVPDALLRVAHLHAEPPLRWDVLGSLGANVVSFSESPAGPTLAQVRDEHGLAVMGGWDEHGVLRSGEPDAVVREGLAALDRTGGRGHLLAPGCSLVETTDELLAAARRTPRQWIDGATR